MLTLKQNHYHTEHCRSFEETPNNNKGDSIIQNTIEQHVTILKGSNYPNLLILAAHSGKGDIAYFEKLDELTINDEVFIQYRNDKKTYIVKEIWEEKKNGKIHIDNNTNQLILTTCSPKHKNYQLIISCIKKESIT